MSRELCGDYKWTVGALKAIHEGSEAFLITILEYGNLAAIHGGRVTIMPKDIQLVMKIKEVMAVYKSDEPLTGPTARERRAAKQDDGNKRKEILLELRFKWGKMIAVESGSSGDPQNGQPQLQPGTSGEPQPGTSGVSGRTDNDNSESDDSHPMWNNIISDDDSEDDFPQNGKKQKRIISESTDEENDEKKRKKEDENKDEKKKDEQKKQYEEKEKKDEQKKKDEEKRKKDEQKKKGEEKQKKDEQKKKNEEKRKKDEQKKKDEEKRKKDEQKKKDEEK